MGLLYDRSVFFYLRKGSSVLHSLIIFVNYTIRDLAKRCESQNNRYPLNLTRFRVKSGFFTPKMVILGGVSVKLRFEIDFYLVYNKEFY